MTRIIWSIALILLPITASGQGSERKRAQALRVADGAIQIDGRLSEEAWTQATPITDFVQQEPGEGQAATDPIEVRFAFDGEALYVGARMAAAGGIQAPLGRRDEVEQAEHLQVSLDTYYDRRTAYSFGVSASGVRLDYFHPTDDDFEVDNTFNPVWQARTAIDANGWTAELWIPFSQLRFNERAPQVWGLNVRRWMPHKNEEVYWSPVLRTDERWASLFGELHGLDGIRPPRRLELLPYVAGGSRLVGGGASDDPFTEGANLDARIGADLKVGIGSNLTLEATVNPDFGQVEADPAEVNLSAFETFFTERRTFFVEGANLLTGNVDNYFYSRRIGATPAGRAEGEFVEHPATSTILGAAKLTGRLGSGTSVGLLGAVTDEESARTFANGQFFRVDVTPRTFFGVGRVTQEIGEAGSTIGLMATAVHRALDMENPLAALMTRSAFSVSGDSVIRFGDYQAQAYAGVTHVKGEPAAIERLQRASARYLQRPDADYVIFDPARTSMSGAKGGFSFERQQARHWLWEISSSFETPGFETNDIGRLTSADGIQTSAGITYQETEPGRWYRDYEFSFGQSQEWNFGRDRQVSRLEAGTSITWPNFWESALNASYDFRRQDMRLTRGGPSMEAPAGWEVSFESETSEATQTQGELEASYGRNEDGGLAFEVTAGITVRPGPRWQVSLTPGYEREVDTQQFVSRLPGGGTATYGSRYIFGEIDRSTYSAQVRLNYTFNPDLTLDFYGEPFAASGQYTRFGQLAAPRTRQLLPVDPTALGLEEDFNVRSFRSNLVLRWEWRPGSTLYLVWQQDREADAPNRIRTGVGDLFGSFNAPGDNFFAVKASFWFSPF